MADSSDRVVFAPFELDVRNCELRRDGVLGKVPPQPFTALVLLVRQAGNLVTREELRTAIWGAERHVDFDGGLNFCIAQLREALSDPASESKFIAAVPRRGYRFVAAVERAVPVVEPTGRWRTRLAIGAAALGVAIAAVVVTAVWMPGDTERRVPRARSLTAVQYYERGASGLADASPQELLDRATFFERAIREERDYAEAYAGLAAAKLLLGN